MIIFLLLFLFIHPTTSLYNLFDDHPNCKTSSGADICKEYHGRTGQSTGQAGISEWKERLSVALTGQLRMDPETFKTLYSIPSDGIACELPVSKKHFGVKGNPSLWPLWYHSALAQAALFQAWSNEKSTCGYTAHTTCDKYTSLFDDKSEFKYRFEAIVNHQSPTHMQYGENALAGRADPLDAIKAWLGSNGHCSSMFSTSFNMMGAGVEGGSWIHVFMVAFEMKGTGCDNNAAWKDSFGETCQYYSEFSWINGIKWDDAGCFFQDGGEGQWENCKGTCFSNCHPLASGAHILVNEKVRYFVNYYDRAGINSVVDAAVYINGIKQPLSLLSGTNVAGTYSVELPKSDTCVAYYFMVDGHRLPETVDTTFNTAGIGSCSSDHTPCSSDDICTSSGADGSVANGGNTQKGGDGSGGSSPSGSNVKSPSSSGGSGGVVAGVLVTLLLIGIFVGVLFWYIKYKKKESVVNYCTTLFSKYARARKPIPSVLPPGWERHHDDDKEPYYYNTTNKHTSYTHPGKAANETVSVDGWEMAIDEESGEAYYYHEASGITQWEPPTKAAIGIIQTKSSPALPTRPVSKNIEMLNQYKNKDAGHQHHHHHERV